MRHSAQVYQKFLIRRKLCWLTKLERFYVFVCVFKTQQSCSLAPYSRICLSISVTHPEWWIWVTNIVWQLHSFLCPSLDTRKMNGHKIFQVKSWPKMSTPRRWEMIIVIWAVQSPGEKCTLIRNNPDIYWHVKNMFPPKNRKHWNVRKENSFIYLESSLN